MVKSIKIDGVSYNIDHARAIGKEAFGNSKELQHHHQHQPEGDRKKTLTATFDQIVAPPPTPSPAVAALN